jgi:hypothetical protein
VGVLTKNIQNKLAFMGRSPGLSSAVAAGLDLVMAVLTQTFQPARQAIAAQTSARFLVGDRECVGRARAPAVMPRSAGHGGVAL